MTLVPNCLSAARKKWETFGEIEITVIRVDSRSLRSCAASSRWSPSLWGKRNRAQTFQITEEEALDEHLVLLLVGRFTCALSITLSATLICVDRSVDSSTCE